MSAVNGTDCRSIEIECNEPIQFIIVGSFFIDTKHPVKMQSARIILTHSMAQINILKTFEKMNNCSIQSTHNTSTFELKVKKKLSNYTSRF